MPQGATDTFKIPADYYTPETPVTKEDLWYATASASLLDARGRLQAHDIDEDEYEAIEYKYMFAYITKLRMIMRDPEIGYTGASEWTYEQLVGRNNMISSLPNEDTDEVIGQISASFRGIEPEKRDQYIDEWEGKVDRKSAAYQAFLEISELQLAEMLHQEYDRIITVREYFDRGFDDPSVN